jgi:predicted naringenin-chalcone synthase
MSMANLVNITTSSPPYKVTQQKAAEELKKRMGVRPAVGRLIDTASAHSGIESRFIIIPDAEESSESKFYSSNGAYIKPDTKMRMLEYEKWSKQLSKDAVSNLLINNNIKPDSIERIITVSCTGFFAPGLDYYLMNEFNIPFTAKRTNIGFMGCAAVITGFNSVFEAINSAGQNELNTLLLSVELCSIHLQTEPTRDNILANMIFADGCAAALFSNSKSFKPRLELVGTKSVLFRDSAKFMGWQIGNFGFEMMLSSDLPKIILNEAMPALKKLFGEIGIEAESIKYWALHPGGRAILDALQSGLNLPEDKMIHSRNVLKNYGNMSSASILFVLKEILIVSEIQTGDYCCAVAFGPGLTMEMALFKGV